MDLIEYSLKVGETKKQEEVQLMIMSGYLKLHKLARDHEQSSATDTRGLGSRTEKRTYKVLITRTSPTMH